MKDTVAFIELNDGSSQKSLQVLVEASVHPLKEIVPTGTSLVVTGELKEHPKEADQVTAMRRHGWVRERGRWNCM